jgi:hypothetical protein
VYAAITSAVVVPLQTFPRRRLSRRACACVSRSALGWKYVLQPLQQPARTNRSVWTMNVGVDEARQNQLQSVSAVAAASVQQFVRCRPWLYNPPRRSAGHPRDTRNCCHARGLRDRRENEESSRERRVVAGASSLRSSQGHWVAKWTDIICDQPLQDSFSWLQDANQFLTSSSASGGGAVSIAIKLFRLAASDRPHRADVAYEIGQRSRRFASMAALHHRRPMRATPC